MGAEPIPEREAAPTFEGIFEREFGYIWHALRRLGVPARDLEDLTQHVFLQVHGQLPKFDAGRPLRPWLFAFALNAAANYRALKRHRVELSVVPPEPLDPRPGAEEQLILQQELQLAELALSQVALERRGVLILREMDGYAVPQIAEVLGIPLNTAYSRLRLARQDYERAIRRLRVQRGEG
jgi:RNA polymerase sigma-70 factor (ECF subfamily)